MVLTIGGNSQSETSELPEISESRGDFDRMKICLQSQHPVGF
jgi:hypothetical protein